MRKLLLPLLLFLLVLPASYVPANAEAPAPSMVLVLVDGLTWEEVERIPGLRETFKGGAAANLSTVQGAAPGDPRLAYALLGAGSRADTSLLPEELPRDAAAVPEAFEGAVSSVQPGSLGEALARDGVRVAAVGGRARLAVMDGEGRVAGFYPAAEPVTGLRAALGDGPALVAVETGSPDEAGRIAETAREAGAAVAVASPNAPPGAPNLTPFALAGPEGLLYSPATRTEALLSSSDVAPTLLDALGVGPPPGMQGRTAAVVPGTTSEARRFGGRLAFVEGQQFVVCGVVGAVAAAGLLAGGLWRGRAGVAGALLWMAALPAAALAVAAVPAANVPAVAATILVLSAAVAALSRRLSGSLYGAVALVYLGTAALILLDASLGGPLMKLSVLGYNPAHGTRFYGIGNEYAAFLAGSLAVGLGALARSRRISAAPALAILAILALAVLVFGLPTMGANVGGSLALGFGLGATLGLIRGGPRSAALWAAGGSALAAALFLASGRLFPGVSHGSRAAGGETDLVEIAARKLLLSLDLLSPVFFLILAGALVVVFAAWRRLRGTPLAAGLSGAVLAALATGALNDSGIVAAIYVLAYPAAAALMVLIEAGPKVPGRVR